MGQNPPGPQPYLFHCIWENKTWEGPERGGIGILCRRCTRQSRLQQVACKLVHLTRGEESSLLLHEPPQLGAAPPTHPIGRGSVHFDCYGPNKCGCATISKPNPYRDRGPTRALGHWGRAPRIKSQTRPLDQWDLQERNAPYVLHVLSNVWEALQRFIKRGFKRALPLREQRQLASPRCPIDPHGQIVNPLLIHATKDPPQRREAGNATPSATHASMPVKWTFTKVHEALLEELDPQCTCD